MPGILLALPRRKPGEHYNSRIPWPVLIILLLLFVSTLLIGISVTIYLVLNRN